MLVAKRKPTRGPMDMTKPAKSILTIGTDRIVWNHKEYIYTYTYIYIYTYTYIYMWFPCVLPESPPNITNLHVFMLNLTNIEQTSATGRRLHRHDLTLPAASSRHPWHLVFRSLFAKDTKLPKVVVEGMFPGHLPPEGNGGMGMRATIMSCFVFVVPCPYIKCKCP